jgi:CDP-glucose 4,6-dehydratase
VGLGERTLEGVVSAAAGWRGRSVLLTGHTGFKGGWLALWLHRLGAAVHGYSLEPPTDPSFFETARIGSVLASDARADIASLPRLVAALAEARPEIVFHLAAQSLVRESYRDPLETFATNVMGTGRVLEAVRRTPSVRAVVVITTDKVYENLERPDHAYGESDALGGYDPYSASKAAAEIVAASYRSSFFSGGDKHNAHVATARAGNVIGGGDWAVDRLVPDCLRAFDGGSPLRLRYPNAVRPWQHVLEPLSGYLRLAEQLLAPNGREFASSWNFGPDASDDAPVGTVAKKVARLWDTNAESRIEHAQSRENAHEAGLLRLDSSKARKLLGWRPRWALDEALARTVSWHRAWKQKSDLTALSLEQIGDYEKGTT